MMAMLVVTDALAFDNSGNLYVTGGIADPIEEYTPAAVASQFAPSPNDFEPDALAFGPAPAPVPEPNTLSMLFGGLVALGLMRGALKSKAQ